MPLRRRKSTIADLSDPFFVAWTMMDGDEEVRLVVGTDTLHNLGLFDGRGGADPETLWAAYRDELEQLASELYIEKRAGELLLRFDRLTRLRTSAGNAAV